MKHGLYCLYFYLSRLHVLVIVHIYVHYVLVLEYNVNIVVANYPHIINLDCSTTLVAPLLPSLHEEFIILQVSFLK